MTTLFEVEVEKLRKAAGEAVRRGIEESDWLDECIPHLADRVGEPTDRLDHTFATNICLKIWRIACEEEGLAP